MKANWGGLVARTDGSDDVRMERMGAGYAIGDKPIPILIFSAPVGGSLTSIRPEAASLLQILRYVAELRLSNSLELPSRYLLIAWSFSTS